jgi:hypothetical protein
MHPKNYNNISSSLVPHATAAKKGLVKNHLIAEKPQWSAEVMAVQPMISANSPARGRPRVKWPLKEAVETKPRNGIYIHPHVKWPPKEAVETERQNGIYQATLS